jgi:hypothetical protein
MTRSEGESEAGLVWAAVQRTRTKDDDEDDIDGSSGLQRWGRKTMRGEQRMLRSEIEDEGRDGDDEVRLCLFGAGSRGDGRRGSSASQ